MSENSKKSEKVIQQFNSFWSIFATITLTILLCVLCIHLLLLVDDHSSSKFVIDIILISATCIVCSILIILADRSAGSETHKRNQSRVKQIIKEKYNLDLQDNPIYLFDEVSILSRRPLSALENGKKIEVYLELSKDETDVILHRV